MGYVRIAQLGDTPIGDADLRDLADLLRAECSEPAATAVAKITGALRREELARQPISFDRAELELIWEVVRDSHVEREMPSLTQFRTALEQLLA
jgi:hypothetical protein